MEFFSHKNRKVGTDGNVINDDLVCIDKNFFCMMHDSNQKGRILTPESAHDDVPPSKYLNEDCHQ